MLQLEQEFPLDPDVVYLNHAAVAPWPKRTADAISAFARENASQGALDYPRWMTVEQRLRERLARLLSCQNDDVALLKNTSEGLSLVAQGLEWQAGDNIVGIANEFPSNRIVWEALNDQGVEFRAVDVNTEINPEAALLAACDTQTRLLAVSSAHYITGQTLDLAKLGAACRQRDILFCVDAIQTLGAWPIDVVHCQIDFLAADGHKWLLGPEGLAVFYCRPELREQLKLRQFGWHMLADPGDYLTPQRTPSPTARRFECGSPNMLGTFGLEASLAVLEEIGFGRVGDHVSIKIGYLWEQIDAIPGVEVLSPSDPARQSGIFSFRIQEQDSDAIYRQLMQEKIVCACRGGGIRFSPHCYTPDRKSVV